MNEGVLDKLFSLEFLGTWLITLLIIAFRFLDRKYILKNLQLVIF
jgi:hypothetical protein